MTKPAIAIPAIIACLCASIAPIIDPNIDKYLCYRAIKELNLRFRHLLFLCQWQISPNLTKRWQILAPYPLYHLFAAAFKT